MSPANIELPSDIIDLIVSIRMFKLNHMATKIQNQYRLHLDRNICIECIVFCLNETGPSFIPVSDLRDELCIIDKYYLTYEGKIGKLLRDVEAVTRAMWDNGMFQNTDNMLNYSAVIHDYLV